MCLPGFGMKSCSRIISAEPGICNGIRRTWVFGPKASELPAPSSSFSPHMQPQLEKKTDPSIPSAEKRARIYLSPTDTEIPKPSPVTTSSYQRDACNWSTVFKIEAAVPSDSALPSKLLSSRCSVCARFRAESSCVALCSPECGQFGGQFARRVALQAVGPGSASVRQKAADRLNRGLSSGFGDPSHERF